MLLLRELVAIEYAYGGTKKQNHSLRNWQLKRKKDAEIKKEKKKNKKKEK
jgi:hypothetical protein